LTFELTLKNRLWLDILDTIIIAISVIVCAIPEGLPLAVTISLSYSSQALNRIWYDLGDKSDPKKLNLPKAVSDATNAQ